MKQDLEAIERNETWELVSPPANVRVIGVKWLFKTKYNEKGEIDKHKARLVAKGYAQKYGVDYTDVFVLKLLASVPIVVASNINIGKYRSYPQGLCFIINRQVN